MNSMDLQWREKLERLQTYLKADPQNPSIQTDIGLTYYQLGQWDEATAAASRALQLDSGIAAAQAVLGLTAARLNDFSSAVTHLKQAILLGDEAPQLQYQLADALIRTGHHTEAEPYAEAAAKQAQLLPLAPALYIRTLHYLGKLEEAIAYGETVETSNQPALCGALFYGALASVYLDSDDLDNARRTADLARQQDPLDIDGNTTAGMLALADTDAALALETFKRVLDQRPKNGRAWLGVGLSHFLTGDLDQAAGSLSQAAEHMKDHLGTLNALAWVHILRKDTENAEATLLRALALDRTFAETHGTLAVVALMKGDLDSATQSTKRAHGLDLENFAGNFASSLIQQVSGNTTQAQAILEQLLTTPVLPGNQTLREAIAIAFAKSH